MSRVLRRVSRSVARETAGRYGARLVAVPESEWPQQGEVWTVRGLSDVHPIAVWISRDLMVQVFRPEFGGQRITVNRTAILRNGQYADGISWDTLQRVKAEIGFADRHAVEIYPADCDLVNVANMRHLWLLDAPLPFAWRGRRVAAIPVENQLHKAKGNARTLALEPVASPTPGTLRCNPVSGCNGETSGESAGPDLAQEQV